MGRKFLAALLAAASIMPSAAMAQERGDRGDRGGRWSGERMQQRPDNGGAWRSRQQSAQQTQPQRPQQPIQAPQGQAPQAQAPQFQGGWQQRQRADQSGGWQQRDVQRNQAQPGGWNNQQRAQQPRGYDRPFSPADRQVVPSDRVTRDAYRADRDRNGGAFQRDRQQDRRFDAQRNWSRNSAVDRNDQRRWDGNRSIRGDQRGWNGGGWNSNGHNNGGWNNNRYDRGNWNRDWRRDSRYDWNRWRGANRNAFRLPRYYAPYGWNSGYRQFGIGAVLSSLLFAQDYWINDPYSYRLPEVGGEYRWVRYYNDALLVDVYSGEVVDVVNNIFW